MPSRSPTKTQSASAKRSPLLKPKASTLDEVLVRKPGGAVRCVFVNNRAGKFYKLSREDFEAWVFDQKINVKSHETSDETQDSASMIKELKNEIMQLQIDVGVRKQLTECALGI
jgi:hypothetical protein